MASQKNTHKIRYPNPKIKKKEIVTGNDFDISRNINPINQIDRIYIS